MHPVPVRLRRARRTDFTAIMRILAGNGLSVPPPDRATLRRFRRLVSDLGADLYVAVTGEQVVGFIHTTYTRQLTVQTRARLEALVVEKEFHRRGIGTLLVVLACQRARQRSSVDLTCAAGHENDALRAFLGSCGWTDAVGVLRLELSTGRTERTSPTAAPSGAATARSSDA